MRSTKVQSTEPFQSLTQCFGHARNQARKWSIAATWIVLVSLSSAVYTRAQSISFFGAFNSYSQTIVAFPQGIVADGSGNLYLSGTTNLTYVPVNASGVPQSSSEFHIDNCCGNAYGLAIDNENNLYRPDISNASAAADTYFPGMTGTCGVAKYTYNSLNNFSKSCIGTGWVHPSSVAVDSNLNVYVLEASTGTIYKLAPSGSTYIQTTLYGPDAALQKNTGMSIDSAANLYITSGPDTGTSPDAPYAENATAAVYKLTLSSGSYTRTSLGSGWTSPSATAVDFAGNIWVSDYSANEIYVLVPSGSSYTQTAYKSITNLRTLVTNKTGQLYGLGIGSPDAVVWTGGAEPHNGGTSPIGTLGPPVPVTVVFDAPTDVSSYSVVTQGATGLDFTDAGGGTCSAQTYAAGTSCTVNVDFGPQAPGLITGALVIEGPAGAVLGADNFYGVGNAPVARFSSAVISSYVGTGNACDGTLSSCGDTGSATSATLNNPNAVAFDASGNLYIADTADYSVREVTPGGTITTIAGSGAQCGSATDSCGDGGLATSATFTSPTGVAMDAAGNLYIVDAGANRIRKVAAGTGIITTIAGNGSACSSSTAACGDGGAATSATFQMEGHGGAVVDQYANLVIADYGDNRLRNINLNTGIITTVAGTGTACGTPTAPCGDGGQATSAQLAGPIGLGIDISGDYFIADSIDNRIRELSALTGVLTTIAGSGTACSSSPCGDGGAATSAQLNSPMTATADPAGNIYIADLNDNTIRVVSASTRLISAVAGNYSACSTSTAACGDAGRATSANLSHPSGLALNASGNIFIAEATNRVREVNITQAAPLTFTALPNTASATQPVSITNVGNASFTFLGSPGFPAGFGSSANTCTGSLTADSSCTLAIELTPTAAGSYAGDVVLTDNNLGVASATQSIMLNGTVALYTPTITIGNLPASAAYGASFTPIITYSGDGTPSVASNSTGVCTVMGGVVHFVAVGTCSLTASATAGTDHAAITGSAQTFTVGQATPTITIASLPSSAVFGGSFNPSITYSGDGTASIASNSPGICIVTGGVVHFVAVGTCSLTASATASTDYAAVTGSAQTFTVGQATPTITIANLPSSAAYGGSFTPTVTYSGDGTASVVSNSPAICTVMGGVVHFVAVGTCSLTASATAGTNYTAIAGSAQTFTVGQATPTITFVPSITTYAYSPSATFSLSATSTSNLAVSFSTATPSVCTVSGSTVTIVSAGTCTIQAFQAANSNYAAPQSVSVSFNITQATQTITFAPLSSPVTYGVSPIALLATGGASGSAVTFDVVSGPGSVSGNTLTITGVGTVVVAANQAGNINYSAAAQVTRSIVVIAANLNLNFNVTALAFGSEPLGSTSSAQTLIIINPNGSAITITGIGSSGDFSASANCPAIAPFGSCSVNVTFRPSVAGARAGTLTVTDAQSNSPQSIPLTGTGAAPGIQVTPSLLTFGSQVLATTSTGQTIIILNDGTANLVLSNVTTTGDFATTGDCAGVPAGSNCNLTVTFKPTAIGARTGTVTLTDNIGDGNQSQLVNLSGAGSAAGATLAPSVLTFPSTVVGATSFLLNTTLTNTGTAPLTGIAVSILGDYTQANVCPATLAPGATCTISANYAPTVAGTESGSLIVTDNLGTQTVSLLGTGLVRVVSLSNTQLVFGGQLINTSSLAQTVVFTNSGSSAVNITSIVATPNFADTTNCSGSIAAGASCSVNVSFTPTTAGPLSGTLTITDTAGPQVITALGQGVRPSLAVAPSFVIFGAQVVGTTSLAQTLTATNTGTVDLTLNPITVSTNFSESDQCLTTLPPGASCSISLSFSPTSTGTLSGSLVISDTSGLSSTLATVSGQSTLPGLTAAPSTLSFGSLPVGTASQAQTVTVWNTGAAPLEIGNVGATGDFAETNTCASTTIAVGSYCIINVTMTPTSMGTRTGTIQINDNADGAYLIALSGMGQQTGVTIFPTSLAFGSLPFTPSAQASLTEGTPLDVTINNTGNRPLQLGGFSTEGDFSASNSCGDTVSVGSSCTVTVNFVPTALGNRTGTLTITDNAGGGTQSVSLEGDGSPHGLTLSPPVLTFGVQTVGVTSQPQAATLTNHTGQSIANLAISPSGEFNQSGNCGATLANGASCILNITVTPVTTGSITGAILVSGTSSEGSSLTRAELSVIPKQVSGNSSDSSLGLVAVSATAIPPGLALSVPKLSFSVTSVGTPSTFETLTLQNSGAALPLTSLTISETNVPEFPFTTNCQATLAPQATCTVTIHFTPTAPGLRAGTLNITAGGGISAALPESGTSIVPVYQLAFSTPPASTVALGGNAGSSITVLEKNSSGNIVASAAGKITLTVTDPNGYSNVYAAEAVAGVASFNLSSNLLTTAGPYTYLATITADSSVKPAVATETVSQVASSVILTSSSMESMLRNTVTFTATVNGAAGTPTGTVNFMDGTTSLGSGALSAGMAAFTTSSLAVGSHAITAVYGGDTNSITATSGTLAHVVIDFALSAGIGGSGTSQTVIPGGAATYTIAIAPTAGTAFPAVAILTVTGLPSGATAELTSWTQLTGTSWQLPANTTLADVSLTFHVPSETASVRDAGAPLRRLPLMLWGILLLPFAGKRRRAGKRMGRTISLLLLLATGAAAMTVLSGCGSTNGFFGQPQKVYIVTVTVTTGTLSHSTNVTLTVE
jgi:trimeric autotransporter adhesin